MIIVGFFYISTAFWDQMAECHEYFRASQVELLKNLILVKILAWVKNITIKLFPHFQQCYE